MSNASAQAGTPRIAVDKQGQAVELCIPANVDDGAISHTYIAGLLRESGVVLNQDVDRAIDDAVQTVNQQGTETDHRFRIAEATPAQHGEDGRVEWRVAEPDTPGIDPDDKHDNNEGTKQLATYSHYERSSFIFVKQGDILADIIPPTTGTDGIDVRGNPIAAKAGKDPRIVFNDSIAREADTIVACSDGVLLRDGEKVAIKPCLVVQEFVDFSTGNIDFNGQVVINKGVKDRFRVRATEDISIGGLVEAADLEAGTNIEIRSGMAGRGKGRVTTGGDLIAKYLDSVHIEVFQNLCIRKEIINCETFVHGVVDSPSSSVIGGRLVATGAVHVSALGSESGVRTEVVLGSVPLIEKKVARLNQLIEYMEKELEEAERTVAELSRPGIRLSAKDSERLMELQCLLPVDKQKIESTRQARAQIAEKVDTYRRVELHVARQLNEGVVIILDAKEYRLNETIRGPLEVFADRSGRLMYQRADGPSTPLSMHCDTQAATA